ncbi:MAG TPA: SGNH/GDSL hydrolase family protein [Patescibacteria group bacterium]|nr:SGNH/GDSL hydrolase family protein [Patescibacteria group bacterium]
MLLATREVLNIGRLIVPRNSGIARSPVLDSPFVYRPQSESNMLVCFGDSNMTGGVGGEVVSPANWVLDLVQARGIGVWNLKVYAEVGATTARVMDKQLKEAVEDRELINQRFDVWLNVGGNDMLALVNNAQNAQEIAEMMRNPRRNILRACTFIRDVNNEIEEFGKDFSSLLIKLMQLFPNRINNVVANILPDFSVISAINTGVVNGEVFELSLSNPWIRRLVHNVSLGINNKKIATLETFSKGTRSPAFLAINTFDFPPNYFHGDEHFNDQGKEVLAQRFVDRIRVN